VLLVASPAALADCKPSKTTVLGPLVGEGAALSADNVKPLRIRFYGTDLGFTYEHQGKLQILFGDTMANEEGAPIDGTGNRHHDDSFGSIDLTRWNDPSGFSSRRIPVITIAQNPGTADASGIDPGHRMEGFKTPVGGFSNGEDEFAVFFTYKPQGCASNPDCSNGMQCDTGLGYSGFLFTTDEGLTLPCRDDSSATCHSATLAAATGGSGLCVDPTSSIAATTDVGRISSTAVRMLVGMRNQHNPKRYAPDHSWMTNRFLNVSVRTVRSFVPPGEPGESPSDYRPATQAAPQARVFLWGRPGFIGVGRTGRVLAQYFAYADLPAGRAYSWNPRYFAGLDAQGRPIFSGHERDAAPLDLDATRDGAQATEPHDVVNQVSIAWAAPLRKWVMFYGGGLTRLPIKPSLPLCGVLELFTGSECRDVVIGNGAFRMRTADEPWGPWSPPMDLIAAGDPNAPPRGQYGIGGMLRHPRCTRSGCAPHTRARDISPAEYGFFYGANIVEQWIRPAGDGVDVIWNASTWDPYRVILLRTHITC